MEASVVLGERSNERTSLGTMDLRLAMGAEEEADVTTVKTPKGVTYSNENLPGIPIRIERKREDGYDNGIGST